MRITLVSPPELARLFPGPNASTSVTACPPLASWCAAHAPRLPAPTTTTVRIGYPVRLPSGNYPEEEVRSVLRPNRLVGGPVADRELMRNDSGARRELSSQLRLEPPVDARGKVQHHHRGLGDIRREQVAFDEGYLVRHFTL